MPRPRRPGSLPRGVPPPPYRARRHRLVLGGAEPRVRRHDGRGRR